MRLFLLHLHDLDEFTELNKKDPVAKIVKYVLTPYELSYAKINLIIAKFPKREDLRECLLHLCGKVSGPHWNKLVEDYIKAKPNDQ